jgi:cellulose 1,4-beta-cellobiosidase
VSAGNAQVTLYRGSSVGATAYNCYWTSNGSTPSKANGIKIAGIANAYVLTGLTNGVAYKFIFTATNNDGESIESSVDTATPIAPPGVVPSAPTLHSVGAGNGYVNLFPGTSAGATSYNAYYTSDGTTPTTGSTKITGATGGQRLTATNGTTYKFVFTAVNAAGESLVSTVDTALPTVNEAVNFLTNTGNYITTIINGLKNYLQ